MRPTGGTSKGARTTVPPAAAAASAVAWALSVRTCVVQTGRGAPSGWEPIPATSRPRIRATKYSEEGSSGILPGPSNCQPKMPA